MTTVVWLPGHQQMVDAVLPVLRFRFPETIEHCECQVIDQTQAGRAVASARPRLHDPVLDNLLRPSDERAEAHDLSDIQARPRGEHAHPVAGETKVIVWGAVPLDHLGGRQDQVPAGLEYPAHLRDGRERIGDVLEALKTDDRPVALAAEWQRQGIRIDRRPEVAERPGMVSGVAAGVINPLIATADAIEQDSVWLVAAPDIERPSTGIGVRSAVDLGPELSMRQPVPAPGTELKLRRQRGVHAIPRCQCSASLVEMQ